ncbi:MAG: helix-turn-helix transcriptional regulator [Nitrospirota bacterium]
MVLHSRIKQLRLERNWKQAELAEKLGIRQKQISSYERGTTNPSTEVLIKLAEVFNVSLDYLAFEGNGQRAKIEVKDKEFLQYFETIDNYEEQERKLAKEFLNLLVMKHKFQELVHSH